MVEPSYPYNLRLSVEDFDKLQEIKKKFNCRTEAEVFRLCIAKTFEIIKGQKGE